MPGGRGAGTIAEAPRAAAAELQAPSAPARPRIAFDPPVPGPLDELARLDCLRMSGALTDEAFAAARDRPLARMGGAGA